MTSFTTMGTRSAGPRQANRSTVDALISRTLNFGLPEPSARLRACVVIPVRNEQAKLPVVIAALENQHDHHVRPLDPRSYEVVLLLNNCRDDSAAVAASMQERFPQLTLHVADDDFDPTEAHVGRARQALFDVAHQRFDRLARSSGLILSTDADSRPASDWIVQNEREIAAGVDGVGGLITLDRMERAVLPAEVRRIFSLDVMYRRALEELRSLYAPQLHDPFPRHHQHFGASLAVTAGAYARAGGMPLRSSSEDVALYHAVLASGGRFRHSFSVRVVTSARMVGRAQGGLAEAMKAWHCHHRDTSPVLVESAQAAEFRLAMLGYWCWLHPDSNPPPALSITPEVPCGGDGEEIGATIGALRTMSAALRTQPLQARIAALKLRFKKYAIESRLLA